MRVAVLGPSSMLHVRRFVRSLVACGIDVHLVSMQSDVVPGASFQRFTVPPFGRSYPYRWRRRWEACTERLFEQFDVVIVHFLQDWGLTERTNTRGRLIVRAYGSDVDPPPGFVPDSALCDARRLLLRKADRIVSPSLWLRECIARFSGVQGEHVRVMPCAADLRLFDRRLRSDSVPAIVGHPKGFEPVYGPETFIDAVPIILARRSETRFEMLGEGSLEGECRWRAEALDVADALRWIGRVPHEAVPDVLGRWTVTAIPSRKESFCISAVEASAMEIPVVASRVGGLSEAVEHGVTGVLVPPDDPTALADAVVALLNDPARRRAIGEAGRRKAELHHDWEAYMERWVQLLEEVAVSTPASAG